MIKKLLYPIFWIGLMSLSVYAQDQEPLEKKEYYFKAVGRNQSIQINNYGNEDVRFTWELNNKKLFQSDEEILEYIKAMPDEYPGEDLVRKVWRFGRDYRYHTVMLYISGWYLASPSVFFNSIGFGFCTDIAHLNYLLWVKLGFEARVWLMDLHVVSEVFNPRTQKWEMYDSDNEVYYLNRQGQVASVMELEADPSLVNDPVQRFVFPTDNPHGLPPDRAYYAHTYAYSDYLASIYANMPKRINSVAGIENFNLQPEDGFSLECHLPPGASIEMLTKIKTPLLSHPYQYDSPNFSIEHYANLAISYLEGWTGHLPVSPLVIHDIEGQGKIHIKGRYTEGTFEIGSDELHQQFRQFSILPGDSIVVEAEEKVRVIYLINPIVFFLDTHNQLIWREIIFNPARLD
ncbi:MAG: hypothetical protein HC880_14940 [Bacteroidia bacterium]|nr:hypothetical protein [Bacteroidia bacterium]